jgi:uncharacterized Zn-finger protein
MFNSIKKLAILILLLTNFSVVAVWHKCIECKYIGKRKDHFDRHWLTHTKERNHICDICSQAFARGDSLKVHIASVHKKPSLRRDELLNNARRVALTYHPQAASMKIKNLLNPE